ncbi:MAG: ATP-binding cassette domain-containing protein [Clostridia bacterium]|nr:ATP-binding cassette domain-containing protein [Clostridia bacterium]
MEVKGLVKYYGNFCAVNNVDFSFSSGKLTALCGRNGSGKTTSIRCLLGLLKEDKGEILINGLKRKPDFKKVGYLPEERGLFTKEKLGFQLEFLAKLKGMSKKEADNAIDYWLKRFEIQDYRNKKLESLSKGNQQKVQMIAALVHDPDIVILDEPFSGLDPVNMQLFIDLMLELKDRGKCILVSSHQLALIEGVCEDICIIDKGESVYSGPIIDLLAKFSSDYLYFSTKSRVEGIVGVENYAPHNYRIKLENAQHFKPKLDEIMKSSIEVETIGRKKLNLQEIFIEMVGGKNERF